ncbi:PcfJ domain-containing protein [Psychrobacillus sp. FSL K6-1464]|uniref:PcfJ domain-containing protein n=1 Tax=Psychrobacillus sp. FSL K6-1464 TaxID=2921545 RepID=UPI0030F65DC9
MEYTVVRKRDKEKVGSFGVYRGDIQWENVNEDMYSSLEATYYCGCGATYRLVNKIQLTHIPKVGLQKNIRELNEAYDIIKETECPECGNRRFFEEMSHITHGVHAYDNEENVRLVVTGHFYGFVKAPYDGINPINSRVVAIFHNYVLNTNKKTGKSYFVDVSKNRVFYAGQASVGLNIRLEYMSMLVRSNEEELKKWSDYIQVLLPVQFTSIGDDFNLVIKKLAFVANKYHQHTEQYMFIPESQRTRKMLQEAKGKKGILKGMFPGSGKQSIKKLDELLSQGKMITMETLTMFHNKDIFKRVLNVVINENKTYDWRETITPTYKMEYSPTLKERFVRYMFAKREQFERVLESSIERSYSTANSNLIDSLRMFDMLYKGFNKEERKEMLVPKKGENLKDVHDRLSSMIRKIQTENKVIEYKESEKKLEVSIGNLDIRLALDTHELVDIGSRMNICVGSYGQMAVNKQVIIATAYEGDKPIVCIEIVPAMRKVVQVKKSFNRIVQNEDVEAVILKEYLDYLTNAGYNTDCHDLRLLSTTVAISA